MTQPKTKHALAVVGSMFAIVAVILSQFNVASSQQNAEAKRQPTAQVVQRCQPRKLTANRPSRPTFAPAKNFIPTPVYSLEDDRQTLAFFDGLRVADVSDGMDQAGLRNTGLVSAEIGTLWRDAKEYKHRFVGIAVTARYVPTNRPPLAAAPSAEFDRQVGAWYSKISPEPFVPSCARDRRW